MTPVTATSAVVGTAGAAVASPASTAEVVVAVLSDADEDAVAAATPDSKGPAVFDVDDDGQGLALRLLCFLRFGL